MGWKSTNDAKVDPSGIKQYIPGLEVRVHCCRYWKLNEWEFQNLSFPFWRLYYNTIPGARIRFRGKITELTPGRAILIPPHTAFSTQLKGNPHESLSGNRIASTDELEKVEAMGMVDHLFIHFNLGTHYDHLHPAIFTFENDELALEILHQIRRGIIDQVANPSLSLTLLIYKLIAHLVTNIPENGWKEKTADVRVQKAIDYIEIHYKEVINNELLAQKAHMACNSFLRLFKQTTGLTIQQYIQKKRIEKAVIMMHDPQASIDLVSEKCGFSDRQHFSKVFKRVVKIPPAQYRKVQIM
jgi:AraC-like DNA-binding protein